jgi:hypothetical protein
MCIKEKWLEEKLETMRKEFEEREVVKNKDKERGEEVVRKFESAIEREKVANRSYQDTFAELERSRLENKKRSVEMDKEPSKLFECPPLLIHVSVAVDGIHASGDVEYLLYSGRCEYRDGDTPESEVSGIIRMETTVVTVSSCTLLLVAI